MTSHRLNSDDIASVLGDRTRVISALTAAFRWSDRTELLERAAVRIAQLLKSELDLAETHAVGGDDDATIVFVEQWVIDVASMTAGMVAAVRELLGDDGLMDFVHSVLVIEQRIRLEQTWRRLDLLPGIEGGRKPSQLAEWGAARASNEEARRLTAALSEWQAAVVCLDQVDPVTTELVRLRCANYHDCHTWLSVRGAVARQHGLDETMAAKVNGYRDSDLPAAQKAALQLADLMMTQPSDIDDALAAELFHHFSESQIVELTLDVMKWNYQKVAVALGVDVEVNPGELTDLRFDADGHWLRPS